MILIMMMVMMIPMKVARKFYIAGRRCTTVLDWYKKHVKKLNFILRMRGKGKAALNLR